MKDKLTNLTSLTNFTNSTSLQGVGNFQREPRGRFADGRGKGQAEEGLKVERLKG